MTRIRLAVLVVLCVIVGLAIRHYIVSSNPAPTLSDQKAMVEVGPAPDIAGVYRLKQGESREIDGTIFVTYTKGKLIIAREKDGRCSWVEGLTVKGIGTGARSGEYSYKAGQWEERENTLLRDGDTLVISETGVNFNAKKVWVKVADDFVADKYIEKAIAGQIAFLNSDAQARAIRSLATRKRAR